MARYASAEVLDDGLNVIKNGAIRQILVSQYSLGDNYATIIANSVAEVTMAPGDYSITGADTEDRELRTGTKATNAIAGSGPAPDYHVAFTDGFSKLYWVTPAADEDVIAPGAPVIFPQVTYTSKQPI